MTRPITLFHEANDFLTGIGRKARRLRSYELPAEASPEAIREKVRADVEDRLLDVCSNWSTGEFDRVVADVTETTLKFHGFSWKDAKPD